MVFAREFQRSSHAIQVAMHHELSPACPACDWKQPRDLGPLPRLPPTFGGKRLTSDLPLGHLFWCPRCDLRFRYPYLGPAELAELYENLPATVWEHSEERSVWRPLKAMLDSAEVHETILDVGCFNGDFLAWLPGTWKKFGIEPNRDAQKVCAGRGVEIVGTTLEDTHALPRPMDVISMIDVIEHLDRPLDALAKLRRWLDAQGTMVLCTGATDSMAWRLFGRHYWYSSLPEHVTFYSLRWFRWAAEKLDMRIRAYRYLSAGPAPPTVWALQVAKQSAYALAQSAKELGIPDRALAMIPILRRARHWRNIPWWIAAKDHILIALSPNSD